MFSFRDIDKNIDLLTLHKMLFIYNAINKGWTVKKNKEDKFEFTKDKTKVKKELYLDNYLEYFTKDNLNIDTILK